MTKLVQENKLRTVINLRGANETSPWYQDEMRESERLGLKHFDFGLSANQEVSDEEIDRILETIRQAPKPVLIHCKSGADRTGLISALYLYREEQKSAESAAGELTIWGGHFPYLFWRKTGAMDVSFERYVRGHAQRPAPQPATGLIGSSR